VEEEPERRGHGAHQLDSRDRPAAIFTWTNHPRLSIRDDEDESGVVGTFILSDSVPSPWNFESGTGENPTILHVEKEAGAGGFYRVMGTEGSLSVPDLKVWSNQSWLDRLQTEDLEVEKEKVPFDLQVQHFYEVVREGKQPSCSAEMALSAMVVCEAIKRSMKSGEGVEIHGFDIREKGSSKACI
jgi:predicted dehydrogenase